jgi:hypothetical protein
MQGTVSLFRSLARRSSPVCRSLSGRTGPSRTCLWVARTEMCQFTLDVRDRDEDQRRVLSLCGKGA